MHGSLSPKSEAGLVTFGVASPLFTIVVASCARLLAKMTSLERLAAVKASAVLRQTTMTAAAKACGVSYNHFWLVIRGERVGSRVLEEKIARFVGHPVGVVFSRRIIP